MFNFLSLDEAEAALGTLADSFRGSGAAWPTPSMADFRERTQKVNGPDYKARYRALVENIPAVIFVAPLGPGLGDAYVSSQIETILGFGQDEWLADPLRWYQQIHPDDKLRWSAEAATLFSSGQPLFSTYRVIARDGRVVWFQCDARMVHSDDGTPSFIHGVGFDVTELRETQASLEIARADLERRVEERTNALARINAELEEEIAGHRRTEVQLIAAKLGAESATRMKTEFLANMSHEMRTPLNGMLGMMDLVLETGLTEAQRRYLSLASSSAESLLVMINQLLDLTQIEAGKLPLYSTMFDLRNSIGTVIEELRCKAEEKGLKLSCEIAPELPDALGGDFARLRQVLSNLIGNAIKFTEAGRVCVAATLDRPITREAGSFCVLRFSIADTGIGISASQAEIIFERFVQADGSMTRRYGGTGLGLTLAKRLVEMMGGEIRVSSELGCGSTFTFTARFGMAEDPEWVERAVLLK